MSRSRSVSATLYIERDGVEIEVELTGSLSPYDPGCTSGPPENCYPPEGGEVEDIEAKVQGKPFELTAAEMTKAEEALFEANQDADDGGDEDYDRGEYYDHDP